MERTMFDDRFVVLVDEEYGYKHHFYFPSLNLGQFIEWWKELESVSEFFYDPANTLPDGDEDMITAETDQEYEQWMTMLQRNMHVYMHLHTDGDSFIRLPNGETIHHKGFVPSWNESKAGDGACMFNKETGEYITGHLGDNLEFVPDDESRQSWLNDIDRMLDALVNDPEVKAESKAITEEFSVADLDGLKEK
jgi:hypothetical protein